MLPAQHRLTRGEDLRRASRSGRRCGSGTLVVHLVVPDGDDLRAEAEHAPARVGFVVGRTVGNSVVRHRVVRRLRHLCHDRLAMLPEGSQLVVRALAPAAAATYPELATDLDRCLEQALADRGRRPGTVS